MNEYLKRFNYSKTDLFGHYANIEMEFYGEEGNQKHIFKVISQKRTNFYNDVPFNECTKPAYLHKEIEEVVGVIHCGVREEDVYYVPLKDIEILPTGLEDKIKAKIEYYKKIDNTVGVRILENLLEDK